MLVGLPWEKIVPVLVSMAIIVSIAIISEYSRTLAAITSVMPVNVPLGMWVAVAGQEDPPAFLADFSRLMGINIIPTVLFIIGAYFVARSGYGLLPAIIGGYIIWGISLAGIFWVRGQYGW